jgi:hypothetical protein
VSSCMIRYYYDAGTGVMGNDSSVVLRSCSSRLLSEVKHDLAWLVLRWGTTLEYQVLFFLAFSIITIFSPSFGTTTIRGEADTNMAGFAVAAGVFLLLIRSFGTIAYVLLFLLAGVGVVVGGACACANAESYAVKNRFMKRNIFSYLSINIYLLDNFHRIQPIWNRARGCHFLLRQRKIKQRI